MFLWRNNNTVVIGRVQNLWKECNPRKMAQDGVKLASRCSGGTVFHDLANTCFTFMVGKSAYDKTISTQIIIAGLAEVGVRAQVSGRNDLIIHSAHGERKISGSAYFETHDRGFHYGTLLINIDLNHLTSYLNLDPKKLISKKGITSVRSRVMNLAEIDARITHQEVCNALGNNFFNYYGEIVKAEIISPMNLLDLPDFINTYAEQSSWGWNFGHAPAFSHILETRFAWAGVELYFDIDKGKFSASKIYTDSLDPSPLALFIQKLIVKKYLPATIKVLVAEIQVQYPNFHQQLIQLENWLVNEIA